MRDRCLLGPADAPRCPDEVVGCVGIEVGLFVARIAVCGRHGALLDTIPAIETDHGALPVVGQHPIASPGCHHPDGRWRTDGCVVPVASRTVRRPRTRGGTS